MLGTFAFYYTQPREPTQRLLDLAEHASRLATVAIQRHRQMEALLESQSHLALVNDNSADALLHLQVEPEGFRFLLLTARSRR